MYGFENIDLVMSKIVVERLVLIRNFQAQPITRLKDGATNEIVDGDPE